MNSKIATSVLVIALAICTATASNIRGSSTDNSFLEVSTALTLQHAIDNNLEGTKMESSMSCKWFFSCSHCATVSNCGWCNDCGKCVEGGATGPAETNCLSWDYKECSGKTGFEEEMKLSNKDELKRRDEMVNEWKLERAAYVLAKSNVARLDAVLKRAMQSGEAGDGEAKASTQNLLPAETNVKSAKGDCTSLTKLQTLAKATYDNDQKALEANEKELADIAKKIGESTDDDESQKLKDTKDALEKTNKSFKNARDSSRTKLEQAKTDATLKCQKADVAEGKLKAVIKAADGAKAESKSRNDLLKMQRLMLTAAQAEMKRATASAYKWSVKIKELTAKLSKIREMKQANSKHCTAKKKEPKFMM
jgi:hypothetical protein